MAKKQREEAQKRRQEIKERYEQMIQKSNAEVDLVLGSKKFLVVVTNCIIMF